MRKLLSVIFVLWVSSAQADDYDLALAATCEKFKSCTFQEFEGQTVPPELKVMLEQGAQAACSGIDSIFVLAKPYPDLKSLGTQCLWSMSKLDCFGLQDFDLTSTPECKTYHDAAINSGK